MPILQEEIAFVLPPILTFLAHFVPDRMTLSVQGWHLDETAAQLTGLGHMTVDTFGKPDLPTFLAWK